MFALVLYLALHGGTARAAAPDAARDLMREQRVARIGYRLALVAASSCDRLDPMTGMGLHDVGSYAQSDRATIRNAYHMGNGFGVRFVVSGGAAEQAGLRAGDEIVALDDRPLAAFASESIGTTASPARTDRFVAALREVLTQHPATLRVERGGSDLSIRLTADRGCGGDTVVAPDDMLNAWSDGSKVAITARLVDFVRDDDELAFVLGHEMSHNILHHALRTRGHSPALASIGIGASVIKTTEIEADRNAVHLMQAAGFDSARAEIFLRRFARARVLDPAFTHPGTKRRIQLLRDVRESGRNTVPGN